MKEITVNQIAKQIKDLIERNVSQATNDDHKWKNHYENVMAELELELKQCNDLIADFQESNLTINVIEQEGYRRCLITMISRLRDMESWL